MEIEIVFLPTAQADLQYWSKSGSHVIQGKIKRLIEAVLENPYEGIGKPKALRHDYAGWWSRRISDEHRLVYKLEDQKLIIMKARFHY